MVAPDFEEVPMVHETMDALDILKVFNQTKWQRICFVEMPNNSESTILKSCRCGWF